MTTIKLREIKIPFSGLYESVHSRALNDAFELPLQDDNGELYPDLGGRYVDAVPYNVSATNEEYADWYANCFAAWVNPGFQDAEIPPLKSLNFRSIESPPYYNFRTDRIFCEVASDEIEALYHAIPADVLRKQARAMFRSYDGFFSHYPDDPAQWVEPFSEWDHNQLYCLLLAALTHAGLEEHFHYWEADIAAESDCNGKASRCVEKGIGESKAAKEIYDIASQRRRDGLYAAGFEKREAE